jgi:hypothetical protein
MNIYSPVVEGCPEVGTAEYLSQQTAAQMPQARRNGVLCSVERYSSDL